MAHWANHFHELFGLLFGLSLNGGIPPHRLVSQTTQLNATISGNVKRGLGAFGDEFPLLLSKRGVNVKLEVIGMGHAGYPASGLLHCLGDDCNVTAKAVELRH